MILIVTAETDTHADQVEAQLKARGRQVLRFNPSRFPEHVDMSCETDRGGLQRWAMRLGDVDVDLRRVHAVWYRRPEPPRAPIAIQDMDSRQAIEQESLLFLNGLWESLDCLVVPAPPLAMRRADLKAVQLKAAAALGFRVPSTLLGNSPTHFLALHRREPDGVVSKQLGPSLMKHFGDRFLRYTEVVPRHALVHAQGIRHCPLVFQAYVRKRVELRVTVVGQQVFAAEIDSQATNHTRHDWRRYDLASTPHRPHVLPDFVRQQCLDLVARLGLAYGAIDLIQDADGHYVFIEINPNGQYLWIEEMTGMPISEAVCDLLCAGAPDATLPVPRSLAAAARSHHHAEALP